MDLVVKALEEDQPSEEAYETFYSCMGCGQCVSECPVNISPPTVLRMAGLEMIKNGWNPPELVYQMNPENEYSFASVFGALQEKPRSDRWFSRAPENAPHADVVMFTGCYPLGMSSTVLTFLDILEKMNVDYAALSGDGLCCGAGHYMVGDVAGADRMVRELVSNIMAFQPNRVVFFCGGCYNSYKHTIPKYLDVPFEPEHYTHFLYSNSDKLPFTTTIDKVVTYHDSCAMGRHAGEYDLPRHLIQAIPGVKLVEMKTNRKDALCCGGLANFGHAKVTHNIRNKRLKEAEATGAEIMVTTCSGCYSAYAAWDDKYPFTVMSDINLIGEAMGIVHENKFREILYSDNLDKIVDDARDAIESNNLSTDKIKEMLARYVADCRPPAS
jgi:Fe-S oxidoreductase